MFSQFTFRCYCLAISSLLLLQPQHSSPPLTLTGHWAVPNNPSSEDFRSPAFGSDIEIAVTAETITLAYSFNRHWTLRLDGTELKLQVPQADGPSYQEVASAHVEDGAVVVATSRNRGGVISREERILRLVGSTLVVSGRRWVDGKLINTSKLTYLRK